MTVNATTSNAADPYALPHDVQETERLNVQHRNLLRTYGGYHIHPTVDLNKPSLRIADIACGSGIWLTEVAKLLPQSECHGFDISPAQFPSPSDLTQQGISARVCFHTKDAADIAGLGDEFIGHFDVVNVRLMHISLVGPQWNRAVSNATALLKPGGHLQWQDWNCETARLVQLIPGAKHEAMDELFAGFHSFLSTRDTAATERIGDMMVQEGLIGVSRETFAADPDLEARKALTIDLLKAVPKFVRGVLIGSEDSHWTEDRLTRLERDVVDELGADVVFVRAEMWWYTGRKPDMVVYE